MAPRSSIAGTSSSSNGSPLPRSSRPRNGTKDLPASIPKTTARACAHSWRKERRTSKANNRRTEASSVDLCAGRLDGARPFHELAGDEGNEFLRRAAGRLQTLIEEPVTHLPGLERLHELGVEALDHISGCSSWSNQPRPSDDFVAWKSLLRGSGQVWKLGMPLRAGDGKSPDFSALYVLRQGI